MPVTGAGVRLGSYLVFTDDAGRYAFPRVPHGDFDLKVDAEFLPARYASDGTSQCIVMKGAARHVADLTVVPLDSIRGRVYMDANRNGRYDAGEGRRGIVVRLEKQVTATDDEGRYGFDNLAPGVYVVRVDRERLAGMQVINDSDLQVTLHAGRAATGIDFVLAEKPKPVVLRPLTQ